MRAFTVDISHDGWKRTAASVPGGTLGYVGATIEQYEPYVAPTYEGEASSAWVIIHNAQAPALYSQVGWIRYATGYRTPFSEYALRSGTDYIRIHWEQQGVHIPPGSFTFYEVLWNPTTQRLEHYIDGTMWLQHNRYFTMREVDIGGETQNRRTQMAGGTENHEEFSDGQLANLAGNVFDFDGVQILTDSDIHAHDRLSATAFDIWDKDCAT